jgi:CheY-like chemotaxis protein
MTRGREATRNSYLVPRTSCLVPRASHLVPRTSYLVPRTTLSTRNSALSTRLVSQLHGRYAVQALPKVLIVEDDGGIRGMLSIALRRQGLAVDAVPSGEEALRLTRAFNYAVILLDLMLPRLNGVEFLEAFHQASPGAQTEVFVMTAFDDASIRRLGPMKVRAIVKKPFDVPSLVDAVREVVRNSQRGISGARRDDPVRSEERP